MKLSYPLLLLSILIIHSAGSCQDAAKSRDAARFPEAAQSPDAAGSWSHFRGNRLNGISSAKDIPINWNDSLNIAWKAAIPGKGWSSPLVSGSRVWLSTAIKEKREFRALCLDLEDGSIIHDVLLFRADSLYRIHAVNSYATPTGAIDGDRVYMHFGRYGTACLDQNSAEVLWSRKDIQVEHIQGPGSSLLIYRDKLIVHLEGSDRQLILGLDKNTGETLWEAERPQEVYDRLEYIGKKAYITPIIIKVGGRELMISNGSAACIAYDPDTGKEIWRIVKGEDSTIAMPVEYNGKVYFYTGFEADPAGNKEATLMAVDPGGGGDVGHSHVLWSQASPILQLLSPLVVNGLLYTIDSKSIMKCIDAATGELIWSERMKGKYHASPVYAEGRIYFPSTRGYTVVIEEGREFRKLAENKVEGEIWASPALIDGAILLRSSSFLYKITGH